MGSFERDRDRDKAAVAAALVHCGGGARENPDEVLLELRPAGIAELANDRE